LHQAERDWSRARALGPGKGNAISALDYDTAQAAYETSKSALAVGEAAVVQAKKAAEQADAAVKKVQKNLGYCTIKSPVKGVIIDRRVNIGQTVVSSLNAPSLFLIAKDLSRMRIWVAVNEVDVGRISAGTPVTFTCDTLPDQSSEGSVEK